MLDNSCFLFLAIFLHEIKHHLFFSKSERPVYMIVAFCKDHSRFAKNRPMQDGFKNRPTQNGLFRFWSMLVSLLNEIGLYILETSSKYRLNVSQLRSFEFSTVYYRNSWDKHTDLSSNNVSGYQCYSYQGYTKDIATTFLSIFTFHHYSETYVLLQKYIGISCLRHRKMPPPFEVTI